jgi:NAD(P)H-quinone oxidoreductase subunit 5
MHAGLINGGGFLLARFAPILLHQQGLLNIIFITGIVTAIIGTLWKLLQGDIKRMLACSTMGQMGFMVVQCGLGLFPAAIAHLCLHGLFKANLFLGSGSAAKEKKIRMDYPPSLKHFSLSLIYGAITAFMFAFTSGKNIHVANTSLFLVFLAMIAGAQFTLPIIQSNKKAKPLFSLAAATIIGVCYGYSVHLIEHVLAPLDITASQPINTFHIIGGVLLAISWVALLFLRNSKERFYTQWLHKKYVQALNNSQPHPDTITTHRNKYQF